MKFSKLIGNISKELGGDVSESAVKGFLKTSGKTLGSFNDAGDFVLNKGVKSKNVASMFKTHMNEESTMNAAKRMAYRMKNSNDVQTNIEDAGKRFANKIKGEHDLQVRNQRLDNAKRIESTQAAKESAKSLYPQYKTERQLEINRRNENELKRNRNRDNRNQVDVVDVASMRTSELTGRKQFLAGKLLDEDTQKQLRIERKLESKKVHKEKIEAKKNLEQQQRRDSLINKNRERSQQLREKYNNKSTYDKLNPNGKSALEQAMHNAEISQTREILRNQSRDTSDRGSRLMEREFIKLSPDAQKSRRQAAEQARISAQHNSDMPNKSANNKDSKGIGNNFIYRAAAAGVGGGLVLSMANNKGQQSNAQLYGQGGY